MWTSADHKLPFTRKKGEEDIDTTQGQFIVTDGIRRTNYRLSWSTIAKEFNPIGAHFQRS